MTDNPEELAKLNEVMRTEELGLEFIDVEGDCGTSGVICVAHKEVAMECDIIYGHHDGHGALNMDKERFLVSHRQHKKINSLLIINHDLILKHQEFRDEDGLEREVKLGLLDRPNSPLGYLPNYR